MPADKWGMNMPNINEQRGRDTSETSYQPPYVKIEQALNIARSTASDICALVDALLGSSETMLSAVTPKPDMLKGDGVLNELTAMSDHTFQAVHSAQLAVKRLSQAFNL